MRHSLITSLVIFLAIFSLVQTLLATVYVSSFDSQPLVTGNLGVINGDVYLCIDDLPTLTFDCNPSLFEGVYYECYLNGTDLEGDILTYGYTNVSGGLDFVVENDTGLFYTTLLNNHSSQGFVNVTFSLTDNKNHCLAYNKTLLTVQFELNPVNDPPIYLPKYYSSPEHIGPLSWGLTYTSRGVFLRDYFYDQDSVLTNFTHSFISPNFNILIFPTSEIVLSASVCGSGSLFVRATDSEGLYDESNVIELDVPCEEPDPVSAPAPSPSPSAPREQCVSEWSCQDWGVCYPNGTQKKKCTDIYACNEDFTQYFWRDCEYFSQCFNGVQDFWLEGYELNEDGIDCGGPCPVCQTCFDGILNNEEDEIDCGGPNCDVCINCFDGILNYGETGVDCGGFCTPCQTCFDGIQNQDEEGVDCGGVCQDCRRLENPFAIGDSNNSLLLLLLPIASLLLVLGVVYKFFRHQINAFIAKFLWFFVRSKRKQVLLSEDQKETLLSTIKNIESSYSNSLNSDSADFQSSLARVLHQIFDYLSNRTTNSSGTLASISKLSASKQLKSLLVQYYEYVNIFEFKDEVSIPELNLFLELLRQLVIDISKTSKQDIARPVHEVEVFDSENSTHVLQLLYNGVIALQFKEVAIARDNYLTALDIYYKLSDDYQEDIYGLLHLVFRNISYVSAYSLFEK